MPLPVAYPCFHLGGKNRNSLEGKSFRFYLKRKLEFDGALGFLFLLDTSGMNWNSYPPKTPTTSQGPAMSLATLALTSTHNSAHQLANLADPQSVHSQCLLKKNKQYKKSSQNPLWFVIFVKQVFSCHWNFRPKITSVRSYITTNLRSLPSLPTPWLFSLTKKSWLVNQNPP